MVTWMSEGSQVILEDGQVHTDVVPLDPAREPARPRIMMARVLDDLVKPERDPGEGSSLFDDIQAVVLLEMMVGHAALGTGVPPGQDLGS